MPILAVPSSTDVLHAFIHRNWPQLPVGSTVEPMGRLQPPSLQNGDWAVPTLFQPVSGSGVIALWRCLGLGLQPCDGCVMWDKAGICYNPVGWHLWLLCCQPSLSLRHRRKRSCCDCSPHPELFWAIVNWLSYDLYTIATNFLSWLEFLL